MYRVVQKKKTVLLSTSLAWPAVAGCSRAETFSQLSSISFAQPCMPQVKSSKKILLKLSKIVCVKVLTNLISFSPMAMVIEMMRPAPRKVNRNITLCIPSCAGSVIPILMSGLEKGLQTWLSLAMQCFNIVNSIRWKMPVSNAFST